MSNEHDIKVTIEADSKGTQPALDKTSDDLKDLGDAAKDTGSKLSKMSSVTKLALVGVAGAVASMAVKSVKSAREMEKVEKVFTNITGSAQTTKNMMADLADFAASTTFDMEGATEGAKKLLNMGFSAQQVVPAMTAIGDAAEALELGSAGVDKLTAALGRMAAKGKVSGEEMRQLAEAGIPAWDMLAKKIGVSIPEAMEMGKKGAIDASTGIQAILSGMNDKFGGSMKEQSGEVLGIWENMKDEAGLIMVAIGKDALSMGDDIVDAFDLKNKLKGALDFFRDFRVSVQNSGLRAAIIEQVPSELIAAAVTGIASIFTVALIPALAAAKTAALAFWAAMGGPVGLAAALAVGAGAYVYSEHSKDPESVERQTFINEGLDPDDYIKDYKKPVETFGMDRDGTAPKLDIDNLGLNFNSAMSSAAGSAKGAADNIKREIDRINESLSTLKDRALDAQTGFDKMRLDNYFSDLEGGDAVIGAIWKPAIDEVLRMQEEISRLTKMQEDAQILLARAQEAGNAEQIAKAQEQANKVAQLKIDAENYADARIKEIREKNIAEEEALHTQVAKTKADIDKAYREGNIEAYMSFLEEKKLAEITDLQERQAMMQQYFDWEMESRQSMQTFMLDAMETLKQGASSAIASAIVNSDDLGKSLANVGKQIVSMFIQWKVQQGIAAAYASVLRKKETAASTSEAVAATLAWTPPAIARTIVEPGAPARAQLSTKMAMFTPFATGGLVTGPTLGLIGEGRYDEAVIPLGGNVFKKFFAPLLGETGGQSVNATQIINGDINNSSDADSLWDNFTENLYGALRSV